MSELLDEEFDEEFELELLLEFDEELLLEFELEFEELLELEFDEEFEDELLLEFEELLDRLRHLRTSCTTASPSDATSWARCCVVSDCAPCIVDAALAEVAAARPSAAAEAAATSFILFMVCLSHCRRSRKRRRAKDKRNDTGVYSVGRLIGPLTRRLEF